MQLSTQQLAKFQELYKRRFGVELANDDAAAMAQSLLLLVELAMKPHKNLDPPNDDS